MRTPSLSLVAYKTSLQFEENVCAADMALKHKFGSADFAAEKTGYSSVGVWHLFVFV